MIRFPGGCNCFFTGSLTVYRAIGSALSFWRINIIGGMDREPNVVTSSMHTKSGWKHFCSRGMGGACSLQKVSGVGVIPLGRHICLTSPKEGKARPSATSDNLGVAQECPASHTGHKPPWNEALDVS